MPVKIASRVGSHDRRHVVPAVAGLHDRYLCPSMMLVRLSATDTTPDVCSRPYSAASASSGT